MREHRSRSIAKGITYRFLGTLVTFIISYSITGNANLAGKISLLDILLKTLLYVAHERAWNRISWGKIVPTT